MYSAAIPYYVGFGSITGSITGNATGIIWQILFKCNGVSDRPGGIFQAVI
jgi:hypothetical protein